MIKNGDVKLWENVIYQVVLGWRMFLLKVLLTGTGDGMVDIWDLFEIKREVMIIEQKKSKLEKELFDQIGMPCAIEYYEDAASFFANVAFENCHKVTGDEFMKVRDILEFNNLSRYSKYQDNWMYFHQFKSD